ncbi:MAG: lipopolysaccharide heptosyltransferase I [Phycisphaerales bacterium]
MPVTPVRSILLIRPSALGDVCRTVPVVTSLRTAFPEASIDWLVHEAFVDAVRHHPDVRGVISFRRGALGKRWLFTATGRAVFRGLVRSLREPGYDLVIDAQGLGRSGLFAYLTGAPRRVGFADARELGWLGVNERIRVAPDVTHSVDRMLALLAGAGIEPVPDMRLYTSSEHRDRAASLVETDRYAVIAPTSRWAGKRWPEDRFERVVEALLDADAVDRVAIVASGSERQQCTHLIEHARHNERVVDLVGSTSVGVLMALIQSAAFVLANDSAPLHMAVGFDRPLVALFGPTRIERVGPYGRGHDVLQSAAPAKGVSHKDEAAGRAMMEAITTNAVIEACLTRLNAPAKGATP